MKLTASETPQTGDRTYTLTISATDLESMAPLDKHDKFALEQFNREVTSIEERLMGLQILARAIERS
jgi:hypothetical protein